MEPTGYVAVALALLVVGLAVAALRNRRGLDVILLRAAAAEESLAALQREVERDRRGDHAGRARSHPRRDPRRDRRAAARRRPARFRGERFARAQDARRDDPG